MPKGPETGPRRTAKVPKHLKGAGAYDSTMREAMKESPSSNAGDHELPMAAKKVGAKANRAPKVDNTEKIAALRAQIKEAEQTELHGLMKEEKAAAKQRIFDLEDELRALDGGKKKKAVSAEASLERKRLKLKPTQEDLDYLAQQAEQNAKEDEPTLKTYSSGPFKIEGTWPAESWNRAEALQHLKSIVYKVDGVEAPAPVTVEDVQSSRDPEPVLDPGESEPTPEPVEPTPTETEPAPAVGEPPAPPTPEPAPASPERLHMDDPHDEVDGEAWAKGGSKTPEKDPVDPKGPEGAPTVSAAEVQATVDVVKHERTTGPGADALAAGKEMEADRDAYLAEYKKYHEQNSGTWRFIRRWTGFGEDKGKMGELLKKYEASQLKYSGLLEDSVTRRLSERLKLRDGKHKNAVGEDVESPLKHPRYGKEVMEKYRGIVRFKHVIKPLAEMKIAARQEALDAKGKNIFEKMVNFTSQSREALEKRYGKVGAVMIKAGAAALVLTLGAGTLGALIGAGPLAGVGAVGVAGFGLARFARTLIGGAVGATAGNWVGAAWDSTGRKAQKKAAASLEQKGKHGALSAADLSEVNKRRTQLASRADEQTFYNKKNAIKALVAFAAGAGTSAALTNLHVFNSLEHLAPPAAPAFPEPPHVHDPFVVGGNIKDADQLMGHFAVKLQHDFGANLDHAPDSVKNFVHALSHDGKSPLLGGNEDHATLLKDFGMQTQDHSMLVRPGDSIAYNDQHELVLDRPGHPEMHHVLVDSKGGIHPIDPKEWKLIPSPQHGAGHAAALDTRAATPGGETTTADSSTPDAPTDAKVVADLNKAQLTKPTGAGSEAPAFAPKGPASGPDVMPAAPKAPTIDAPVTGPQAVPGGETSGTLSTADAVAAFKKK